MNKCIKKVLKNRALKHSRVGDAYVFNAATRA
jgi:hypothetical protein